ncbi:MAG TPA: ABC transporter permease [Thermoplasmata archaeon]|nr:ABC transporter permease [Thermoplasmata archaeon]
MTLEVGHRVRALGASTRLAFLAFLADPQWIIPSTIAPVVFALAAFELYRTSGAVLVLYAILGAAMMSMWGQTLYGSGWATGLDRELGTLEPTLTTPTPYLWVVGGRVIVNAITGLVGGIVVYFVVAAIYQHPLPLVNPAAFAVLFVFVLLSLASVGIVLAAFYVYTRYAGFIQNFGEFAFYVGTGCMFPVVLLPFWATPFALVLPPTWALDALRYATLPGYQGFSWGLGWDLVGAVASTALYLAIAGTVFRRVERHVLEVGDLSDY